MVATTTIRHSQAKVGAALELHAGQKDATRGHEGSDGGGSGVGGSEGVVARNANNCLNGNFRETVAANWPVREGWRDVWSVIRVFLFDTANGGVKRLTKRMTSRQNGSWLRVCRLSTSFVRVYERPRQVSYGCECTAHQCRRIKDAKEDRLKRVPLLMSSHEIYENFSSSRLLLRSRVTRFSPRFPTRRFRLGPDERRSTVRHRCGGVGRTEKPGICFKVVYFAREGYVHTYLLVLPTRCRCSDLPQTAGSHRALNLSRDSRPRHFSFHISTLRRVSTILFADRRFRIPPAIFNRPHRSIRSRCGVSKSIALSFFVLRYENSRDQRDAIA